MYRVFPSLKASSRPNLEHQVNVLSCTENPVVTSLPTTCSRKRNETYHVPFASKKKERKKKKEKKKLEKENQRRPVPHYNTIQQILLVKRSRRRRRRRRRRGGGRGHHLCFRDVAEGTKGIF
jgi:hypothetical protein